MPENFEAKFIQSFTQQQEEKKNFEISPVQAENPETVESAPEVVPKDETHIEERSFLWDGYRVGEVDEAGEYKEPTPEQKKIF
jgi:hypothetical protein